MCAEPAERFPLGADVTLDELERDPHPVLARLRAVEPVSWLPALGGWLVTRHGAARQVMRDPAAFTVDDPRFSTARVVGPSMLSLDGAQHARHRRPFAGPFRRAEVLARFGEPVRAEVHRLVSSIAPRGRAELRTAVAGPLAVAVVADCLGLRRTDPATVLGWYATFVEAVSAVTAGLGVPPEAATALAALRAHVELTIRDGDGATLLAEVVAPTAGLRAEEAVSNAAVLMFGGIDTTESMILNVVRHLLASHDQLAALRSDPSLLRNAVDESLRLEPAAAVVDRYATRDVSLLGASIRTGDLVVVSLAGANRDPAVFPRPDAFDIRRSNARAHLAFAHGPHYCLGVDLALLEAERAVEALLGLPGLRLDPEHDDAPRGLVFRKPVALHVRWDGSYRDVRQTGAIVRR